MTTVAGERASAGAGSGGHGLDRDEVAARLREVAAFEASVKLTPIGKLLRVVGLTPAFASVYRRIGPPLDLWLGRRFKGQVAGRMYGLPALVLVTTGKKTGLRRPSPLLYLRDGDDFLIVGTNFGQGHHPAWTANLLSEPRAEIEVGPATLPVGASPIEEPEFARCWERFVALYPGYAGYLERSGRKPHMFRLRPATR